jgi:hypothetical protein
MVKLEFEIKVFVPVRSDLSSPSQHQKLTKQPIQKKQQALRIIIIAIMQ